MTLEGRAGISSRNRLRYELMPINEIRDEHAAIDLSSNLCGWMPRIGHRRDDRHTVSSPESVSPSFGSMVTDHALIR